MSADKPHAAVRYARAGRWLGVASAIALLAFAANVVMSSVGLRTGWQPPVDLNRVHELLLLLTVAVLAITAALCREKARNEQQQS